MINLESVNRKKDDVKVYFNLDNKKYLFCFGISKNTGKAIYGAMYSIFPNTMMLDLVKMPLLEKQLKTKFNEGLLN
jgi:ABC-type antimicrobial peptide transport system permease subunit